MSRQYQSKCHGVPHTHITPANYSCSQIIWPHRIHIYPFRCDGSVIHMRLSLLFASLGLTKEDPNYKPFPTFTMTPRMKTWKRLALAMVCKIQVHSVPKLAISKQAYIILGAFGATWTSVGIRAWITNRIDNYMYYKAVVNSDFDEFQVDIDEDHNNRDVLVLCTEIINQGKDAFQAFVSALKNSDQNDVAEKLIASQRSVINKPEFVPITVQTLVVTIMKKHDSHISLW